MKTFGLFFALNLINYTVICVNMRYVARGSYAGVGISDALIAVLGFTIVQNVATAQGLVAQSGYVLGGVGGGLLGLWLTRREPK